MRSSLRIVLVACVGLALASCAGGGGYTTPPGPIGTPAPEPSRVKQLVMKGCGYVPTVSTIVGIITASPFVPAAAAVAEAICAAVTTIPFADGPGDRKPRVNGVVVEGYFPKKR